MPRAGTHGAALAEVEDFAAVGIRHGVDPAVRQSVRSRLAQVGRARIEGAHPQGNLGRDQRDVLELVGHRRRRGQRRVPERVGARLEDRAPGLEVVVRRHAAGRRDVAVVGVDDRRARLEAGQRLVADLRGRPRRVRVLGLRRHAVDRDLEDHGRGGVGHGGGLQGTIEDSDDASSRSIIVSPRNRMLRGETGTSCPAGGSSSSSSPRPITGGSRRVLVQRRGGASR